MTSILLVTYNQLSCTELCIDSIRRHTDPGSYEVIVVDNCSADGTAQWLGQQPGLKLVLNEKNRGFPAACNQGIALAGEKNDILLLNNDTIVTPHWLENLRACLDSSPDIGAAGAVSNSCSNRQAVPARYDGREQLEAFAAENNRSDPKRWEERLRLIGYCMLIRNETARRVGLLDERFSPGNFEDDDYSLRIRRAGYRLMLCRDCYIHHFGSASFSKVSGAGRLFETNRRKFLQKWGMDPYDLAVYDEGVPELVGGSGVSPGRIAYIGCKGGETLLELKNRFPSAQLAGVEADPALAASLSFARVVPGAERLIGPFDVLVAAERPEESESLLRLSALLSPEGVLLYDAGFPPSLCPPHNFSEKDYWCFGRRWAVLKRAESRPEHCRVSRMGWEEAVSQSQTAYSSPVPEQALRCALIRMEYGGEDRHLVTDVLRRHDLAAADLANLALTVCAHPQKGMKKVADACAAEGLQQEADFFRQAFEKIP